ncbi:MAG: hypothetical protein ACSHXY_05685 [Alphaproteobacteria bacterium]
MIAACNGQSPDPLETLYPVQSELSAADIMAQAHEAAGGEAWSRPISLAMDGYAVFYKNGSAAKHETHRMWRVYEAGKTDAHKVDGKVRIESLRDGIAVIDLSFDGSTTYTPQGAQPQSESDNQWSSSFGFGVIRHALDDGYSLKRLPDDLVDGRPVFMVNVMDPSGGETRFGIAQDDRAILKVGFDTPRGWHERIYSNFYSNIAESWSQPGRVRLYYNGVKANEVIWTSYEINKPLKACLFVLPEALNCR